MGEFESRVVAAEKKRDEALEKVKIKFCFVLGLTNYCD